VPTPPQEKKIFVGWALLARPKTPQEKMIVVGWALLARPNTPQEKMIVVGWALLARPNYFCNLVYWSKTKLKTLEFNRNFLSCFYRWSEKIVEFG
jgi:hypothetical protein